MRNIWVVDAVLVTKYYYHYKGYCYYYNPYFCIFTHQYSTNNDNDNEYPLFDLSSNLILVTVSPVITCKWMRSGAHEV